MFSEGRETSVALPINILMVEDRLDDADLAIMALKRARIRNHVWVVHDGEAALSFLRSRARPQPDLVLLDLNLPRLNGREVLEAIRADPALCELPVIVLTGFEPLQHPRVEELADAFLTKPVNFLTLATAVKDLAGVGWQLVKL